MAPYILIISLLTIILFWIIRKFIKPNRFRNWISAIAALVSATLLYFIIVLTVYRIIDTPREQSFSQEVWQRDKAGRYEMCGIILDTHLLDGKRKEEVVQLLGNSVREDNETVYYPLDIHDNQRFTSESEALIIHFKDGVVSSVELQ